MHSSIMYMEANLNAATIQNYSLLGVPGNILANGTQFTFM